MIKNGLNLLVSVIFLSFFYFIRRVLSRLLEVTNLRFANIYFYFSLARERLDQGTSFGVHSAIVASFVCGVSDDNCVSEGVLVVKISGPFGLSCSTRLCSAHQTRAMLSSSSDNAPNAGTFRSQTNRANRYFWVLPLVEQCGVK